MLRGVEMGKHPFAKSFRDLIVYQKARNVAKRVFEASKSFPKLNKELQEIGRILQTMIARAEEFKGDDHSRVREESPTYGTINDFFLKTEHRILKTEN